MHKKWEPGTLYAKALRDITNEHNDTVDAWADAVAETERMGRENDALCDQIAVLRVEPTPAQVDALARVLDEGVVCPVCIGHTNDDDRGCCCGRALARAVYDKAYFAALTGCAMSGSPELTRDWCHRVALETVRQWPAMQAALEGDQ